MGGSGGGGNDFRLDQLRQLEKAAKNSIREAAEPSKRCVFISFAAEDITEVNLLRGQAKNTNNDLEFIDRSLQEPFDSEQAEYIRKGIRERIRQSSVTICYLSEDSASSRWVDWEIRESAKLGKGVVALYPGEKAPKILPKAIIDMKIKPTKWNHVELMKAIEKAAQNR